MTSLSLYSAILGLSSNWHISNAILDDLADCLEIHISASSDSEFSCPLCGEQAEKAGVSEHHWLHDNLLQLRFRIVANIPLISCKCCGINRVRAPWEQIGSNFREGGVGV